MIAKPTNDGIFNDLQEYNVPWQNEIAPNILNYGYYIHSARKTTAPFIIDLIGDVNSNADITLSNADRIIIASTVYDMFSNKWNRLWNVYKAIYNPLHNYDMTESETSNTDSSGVNRNTGTQQVVTDSDTTNSGTDTHNIIRSETDGGNETLQKTGQTTNTGTNTIVTDNETTNSGTVTNAGNTETDSGVYGFNSVDSVGANTTDTTQSTTRTDNLTSVIDATETETQNLTESVSGTDTRTRNLTHTAQNTDTNTKNLTESLDSTETRTDNLTNSSESQVETTRSLTRSGNIGVTTSQQMLTSDLELWQWNFFKSVFDDIDSIITIPIY